MQWIPIGYVSRSWLRISRYGALLSLILITGCKTGGDYYTEEGLIPVDRAEIYYKSCGRGAPVLVIHGGPGMEHSYLLPQVAALADHYQLIFYDQRSSGRSLAPTDSCSITLDNFINDIEGLRRALRLGRVNLMGHSFGGVLAMMYAVRYPDRVNSLILVNSGGARSDFFTKIGPNIQNRRTREDSLLVEQIAASPEFQANDRTTANRFWSLFLKPYFYDQSKAAQLTTDLTQTTINNMGLIRQRPLGRSIWKFDIRQDISQLTCPTLLIHGDHDPLPLEFACEIQSLIPGAQLEIIHNCGHYSFVEAPREFYRIVDQFLREKAIR